jgi:uncharacterized protein with HEPN domain
MSRDEATLLDIARAAQLVLHFAAGMDQDAFLKDLKTQSAVLHQLMVIGEAVRRLSQTFRESHPEMSWLSMAGMRDKLIHAYDAADLVEVWSTLERDIPELLHFIGPLLPRETIA